MPQQLSLLPLPLPLLLLPPPQPKPRGHEGTARPSLRGHSPSHKDAARVCTGVAQATRAQPKSARVQPKPQGLSPTKSARAQPKPQGCSPKLRGHSPSHEGTAQVCAQAHKGPSAALALAWTFPLPNASPLPQPLPPSSSSLLQRHQISPPPNAFIA
jgi:hypothetical protein